MFKKLPMLQEGWDDDIPSGYTIRLVKSDQALLLESAIHTLQWLETKGQHERHCMDIGYSPNLQCTCGLDIVMSNLRKAVAVEKRLCDNNDTTTN